MARRVRSVVSPLVVGLLLLGLHGGCPIERLAKKRVADGAARLSVLALANLVAQLEADSRCGFGAQSVKDAATFEGEFGRAGRGSWTVSDCTLDFGALHAVSQGCDGTETLLGGKVTVSATRTMEGRWVGGDAQIFPLSSEPLTSEITASFDGYQIGSPGDDNGLLVLDGSVSFTAKPHVAVSESLGACTVVTSEIALDHVVWSEAQVEITSEGSTFPARIDASDFSVQVGRYGEKQNWMDGTVTVWGKQVAVPSDGLGVDPEYDRAAFVESWSCAEDLALPVSYDCQDITPTLAQGVAQLLIYNFGNAVDYTTRDHSCGFSSPAVEAQVEVFGELGDDGGMARFTMPDCPVTWPAETRITTDCHGTQTLAHGKMTMNGIYTLDGIPTGSAETPVIPTSWQPATVTAEFDQFDEFYFRSEPGPGYLLMNSGKLWGELSPRTVIDREMGACAIKVPIVDFVGVRARDADVVLVNDGMSFAFRVDGATLDAQSGTDVDRENYLAGSVTLDGTSYDIPVAGEPLLDQGYDEETYREGWLCNEDIIMPETNEDCSFKQQLGEIASRLLLSTVGQVASLVNASEDGGFSDYAGVLLFPTEVEGADGEMGSITHFASSVAVGYDQPTAVSSNCLGSTTYVSGHATVNAERTVSGMRYDLLPDLVQSVEPRAPDSVVISLEHVVLEDFVTYDLAAGDTEPAVRLEIASGAIEGVVEPFLGEMLSDPGRFEVPTPVARFSEVRVTNLEGTIIAGDMQFNVSLSGGPISGQNGFWQGIGNWIEGQLTVNGQSITIDRGDLVPGYVQSTFDAGYSCTDDLKNPIDPT